MFSKKVNSFLQYFHPVLPFMTDIFEKLLKKCFTVIFFTGTWHKPETAGFRFRKIEYNGVIYLSRQK